MAEGSCELRLLGGFRAEVDGRPVPSDAWRHRRGGDLVKLLALAPGHRLHREHVIDGLWPDLGAEAGAANLRKAVHFARRALGGERAVGTEGPMLQLWPSGSLSVDVERFEREAAGAIRTRDRAAAARAASRYEGDLLPEDPYAPWAEAPRERLRRTFVQVLKIAGRWDRVLVVDPVDEEAHRALIRAHLEAGNRQAAMRQFERLREALREELGVSPDPETVALYQEVLALEGVEPDTPAERARSRLAAALVALNRMDLQEAEREAKAARLLAVESGLGRELGEASGVLGMVAHSRGRWRQVFREEFLQTVREAPELAEYVFDAHLCLGEFWLYGPEGLAESEAFARELLEIADSHDSMPGRALATLQIGEAELLMGRVAEAETDLATAAALHQKVGARSGWTLSTERLGEAALARGQRQRARRLLSSALELAGEATLSSHLLVRVYGALVQSARTPQDGMAVIATAEEALAGRDVCEPCSMGFRVAATISAARAGDQATSARYLEQAERVAGMWQGGAWQAAVWEARGAFRLAAGEPRQAAALLLEAADRFAAAGQPLAESRCRADAAAADSVAQQLLAGNGSGTPGR
jgi:DNA-binding SARP family transcriptional activator/tetratricopeptide (TPR) repeat protein